MSPTPDELTLLFTELGQGTPDIDQVIEHPSEPLWAVTLDDGLVITAELVEGRGVLCLCADVGRPQEQDRLRVWEAMLMYSSLRQSNGGFSMAVAGSDGECQILGDEAARDLDVERLRTGFLNLAHKARVWRQVVIFGADPSRAPLQGHQLCDVNLWG